MSDEITVVLEGELAGLRLDKALAKAVPDLSRARLQALIAAGMVADDNGRILTSGSMKAAPGLTVSIELPPPEAAEPEPQDIPLTIVFEDEHLIVLDKPAGMVVHPAAGNPDGTLVNALLFHCGEQLSGIGGVRRPGIVHRLDKETSGLMVVAKSDAAHQGLAAQFEDRSLSRRYLAFVWGIALPPNGQIDAAIGRDHRDRKRMSVVEHGGKPARTHYTTKDRFAMTASLGECELDTGRTHQIRVHLASIGHPLIGDPVYGDSRQARRHEQSLSEEVREAIPADRQALHAYELHFRHPVTGQSCVYTSSLPDDLLLLLQRLRTI